MSKATAAASRGRGAQRAARGRVAPRQLPDQQRLDLVTDERPTGGHERRPEGRGGLTRGGHEPAVGAGDGEAHERAAARPRVVEHGAHDELAAGLPASQPGRPSYGSTPDGSASTARRRDTESPLAVPVARAGATVGVDRAGTVPRTAEADSISGSSKRPGVAATGGWLAGAATAPKSRVSCRPLPSPAARGAGRWRTRPGTVAASMGSSESASARPPSAAWPGSRSTSERNSYSRKSRTTSARS